MGTEQETAKTGGDGEMVSQRPLWFPSLMPVPGPEYEMS
jgi:hypothetical protein